jgi:Na+-driven multidrug efflux pump
LVICLTVPDVLMSWFTSRQETIAAGASALSIIAWGSVPSALSITASGALEGLGKGNPSFAITLLRYVVISLPAAWLLCRVFGPDGVWHAFWIFECLAALAAWKIYGHYAPAVTTEKEST